jgi:hypothetical protein
MQLPDNEAETTDVDTDIHVTCGDDDEETLQ